MVTKNAQLPTVLAVLDPEVIPLPSKILVLFGQTSKLHPLVLQSLFMRARRDEGLGLIVGDSHLNEYALARLARAHGFNPASLLARIDFSRPFTCHQLHHCIVDLVPAKTTRWRALHILGLLDTFYDEDIRLPIVLRLLSEILIRLRCIASRGLPVLITLAPPPSETTRAGLITRIIHAADAYWRPSLEAVEHFTAQQIGLW